MVVSLRHGTKVNRRKIMPELPEVETVRRILEKRYVGKKIIDVDILYPKMIHSPIEEFKTNIECQTITSISRKGKYLFINFSNEYSLISHLRMEGKDVLREKIMGIYNAGKKTKTLTQHQREALGQYYKDYKAEHGNSYIDKYYSRMILWEVYDENEEL